MLYLLHAMLRLLIVAAILSIPVAILPRFSEFERRDVRHPQGVNTFECCGSTLSHDETIQSYCDPCGILPHRHLFPLNSKPTVIVLDYQRINQ